VGKPVSLKQPDGQSYLWSDNGGSELVNRTASWVVLSGDPNSKSPLFLPPQDPVFCNASKFGSIDWPPGKRPPSSFARAGYPHP
jgi:hypothetical protein